MRTPIGRLTLVAADAGVIAIFFSNHGLEYQQRWIAKLAPGAELVEAPTQVLEQASIELDEYFAGRRQRFGVPLDLRTTGFRRRVLETVATIGFGQTTTYKTIAERLQCPRAVRAVGAANGANPIPVIIPCHRVLGSDGRLTGFGGGVETKRWLLDLERMGAPPLPVEQHGIGTRPV